MRSCGTKAFGIGLGRIYRNGRTGTAFYSIVFYDQVFCVPAFKPKPLWRKDRRLAEGRGSDALATQRALPRVTKPTQLPKKPRRYTSGG